MKYNYADMCHGPLFKNIILYTVPIILTGVLQLLFNAADLIVVGRYCGSLSVGAVGATGSLISLFVNLFVGLSVGASVCAAQAIGANNTEKLHRIVHTAMPAALICGLFLTAVGLFGTKLFLRLMATPDDVIDLSATYMRIFFCGMPASMLYNFGAAILRSSGNTKGPLYYLSTAGVLNVILNLIFVTVFKMDVAGVALATVISQFLSAVLTVLALMHRTDNARFIIRASKIHKKEIGEIVHIGLPAGIQASLFSISNVIIQSSVNSFGSVVMSGNAAAQNIEGFVYTTMNSFQQTSLNFTGQNYGAKQYKRINKIMAICLMSVSAAGLLTGVTAYIFGKPLLSIYITDSPQAIEYGLLRLSYILILYFLCGTLDVTTGAIRGMGASVLPMAVTIIGVCVFRIVWVFTIFAIPEYHTLGCLYISYPISWIITFAAELLIFIIINRKNIKRAAELK